MKGIPVLREDYQTETIEIAFKPLDGSFEVADAAIRRNVEYIPNISILWATDADLFEMKDGYFEKLRKHRDSQGTSLTIEEEKRVKNSFTRVANLLTYPFTALELSSTIDEEQVAEVFVRINSKGKVTCPP